MREDYEELVYMEKLAGIVRGKYLLCYSYVIHPCGHFSEMSDIILEQV